MPRLVHTLPKYSRHKTGQALVRINGKCHYLGKYDTEESKAAYQRLVATLKPLPVPEPLPDPIEPAADPDVIPRGGSARRRMCS